MENMYLAIILFYRISFNFLSNQMHLPMKTFGGIRITNGNHSNGGIAPNSSNFRFLSTYIKEKRHPLEEERRLLLEDKNPDYLAEIARYKEQYEREKQIIEEDEKREMERIEAEYNQEMLALDKEYEKYVVDIVDTLLQEVEANKIQLESDISALDITRSDGGFVGTSTGNWGIGNANAYGNNQWSNVQVGQMQGKKHLRRRPNEMTNTFASSTAGPSNSTDSNASTGMTEKKGRKRSPGAGHICSVQTLLPAQMINEDDDKLCWSFRGSANMANGLAGTTSAGTYFSEYQKSNEHGRSEAREEGDANSGVGTVPKKPRKVLLEPGKLICDGKSFLRLQNVSIQSANTNWKPLPARVILIDELTIQFRSAIPGDIRIVTATKDDVESGRVVISKRY